MPAAGADLPTATTSPQTTAFLTTLGASLSDNGGHARSERGAAVLLRARGISQEEDMEGGWAAPVREGIS
jgi:hypothetical protein